MATTRRRFLEATAAGFAGATLTGPLAQFARSQPPSDVRIRRDVTSADAQQDIDSYRTAVGLMRQLPANNPLRWASQAGIHGSDTSFNKCQHGTWFFTPWHR